MNAPSPARGPVRHRLARWLPLLLLAVVMLWAAMLRLEALTATYGRVSNPAWVGVLQDASHSSRAILPDAVKWDAAPMHSHKDGPGSVYFSDPYTYLQFARQMPSFYAAHYREPLFPYATKLWLGWLKDQDIAVSFASLSFSLLAVAATYLLGTLAFSWPVGLGAAFAMAIEYDVISEGISGGRDSAFIFVVALAAYAMLRYARRPSIANAVLLGACAGLACLVRITSLSFLVPGLGWLAVVAYFGTGRWSPGPSGPGTGSSAIPGPEGPGLQVSRLSVAVLVTAALVGPYMFNCWRTFGDPLYAINYHTDNYLKAEGRQLEARPTAATYVESQLVSRPFHTLDTIALGLTSYPFLNKWQSFDRWMPRLGRLLEWSVLAGLLLFAGTAQGRLLLLVLVASLVPYAITWRLAADWRFTAHAYPFFLIAAAAAVAELCTWARPSHLRELVHGRAFDGRRALFWARVVAAVAVGAWIGLRLLPVLLVREDLRFGEEGMIQAGERDGPFFGEGWSAAQTVGTLVMRISQSPTSTIDLPLPVVDDYTVTVRLDPYPKPDPAETRLPRLHVFFNGAALGDLQTRVNTARVASYDIHLPRRLVARRSNRLVFTADADAGGSTPAHGQVALWYVRIHPAQDPRSWRQPVELTPTPHQGFLESATCAEVTGWVADLGWPDAAAEVDLFDGETRLATFAAADFRKDLADAGLGNGRHAFRYPLPATLRDGRPHEISVRVAGRPQQLSGSPVTLTCRLP